MHGRVSGPFAVHPYITEYITYLRSVADAEKAGLRHMRIARMYGMEENAALALMNRVAQPFLKKTFFYL
jgi:hypothetical protein